VLPFGCGDEAFAEAIAAAIARDLRELRSALDGYEVEDSEGFYDGVVGAGQAIALPQLPEAQKRPRWVAAFGVLLDKHQA